jgi:hypothetical protein
MSTLPMLFQSNYFEEGKSETVYFIDSSGKKRIICVVSKVNGKLSVNNDESAPQPTDPLN